MANSFSVGSTNLETMGCIQSWDGILMAGPTKGDLIEQDYVDGASWVSGGAKTYSFDVPFMIEGPTLADSLVHLETIKGWKGSVHTLTRVFTIGVTPTTDTCSAVIVSEISPNVIVGRFIKLTLVFQNLSGKWT